MVQRALSNLGDQLLSVINVKNRYYCNCCCDCYNVNVPIDGDYL